MSDILPWHRCLRHSRILAPGETCPDCGDPLATDLLARVAARLEQLTATNIALRERLAAREYEIAQLRARVQALEWAHG